MRYIKDNKVFNTPIVIERQIESIELIDGEEVKVMKDILEYTNDESKILEAGYTKYITPKVPIEYLIEQSNEDINKQTDLKILNGFKFNNEYFYLSMENQFNFKNMYDMRDNLIYPITIKTQDGFMQMENSEQISVFYQQAFMFIQSCIEEGWIKKAEAEKNIRENY